ncbi:MAG: NADH-quinone oxidoreductase subunit K [Legionellaceae bacterium]|nr:NADH-quinone oxidoreductase subunit K [Legionellaceae bacterium]
MSSPLLYALAGVVLFFLAFYGMFMRVHLVQKMIAANIMAAGVFLILIAMAARNNPPDPVPHAMVLTGIVVAVALTAFALVLAGRLHALSGRCSLSEEAEP